MITFRKGYFHVVFLTTSAEGGSGYTKMRLSLVTKTLRVMQLGAVFILGFCLHAAAAGNAQKVTLSATDISLVDVFAQVKAQTGFKTVYDKKLVHLKKVSVDVSKVPLTDFLNQLLEPLSLKYVIENNTIFVRPNLATDLSPRLSSPPPPITIRGRVLNERGEPVIASVIIKGTKTGTTTDNLGLFTLQSIHENAVLVVSGIGIATTEIAAAENLVINVKAATNPLDDVVYKGYYSTSRKLNTGAVSTVGSKEIQTQPVTNPLVAISGRMSGVNILQGSGMPGGAVKIEIRGRNSIRNDLLNNGNLPLYIVDDVPFPAQLISSTLANANNQSYGSPLGLINPADIERIDILKDADATAAYGSRGANGVVLITTKKGKSGKMFVNANIFTGFGKVTRKIDLLNTQQYREIQTESAINNGLGPLLDDPANNILFPDLKLFDSTKYTDWQDYYIGGTARFSSAQVGFSGGTDNVQYLFNSTFNREGTVVPGNNSSERGLFNINLGFSSINRKFKGNISTIYSVDNTNLPNFDPSTLIYTAPNAPDPYIDGEVNWDPGYKHTNPVAELEKKYSGKSNNLVANSTLSYEIINRLLIRLQSGYNKLEQQLNTFVSLKAYDPATVRFGNNSFNNITAETYNLQPEIEYGKHIASGELSVLFSGTWQETVNRQQGLLGLQYTSDMFLENFALAPLLVPLQPVYSKYNYNGFLGKITYNWLNKYIVNLVGRRDGSSRFGANNQFGNFGSVGAAWIFSNESFLTTSSFLSFGKLRGSYGTTGSDQIGEYNYYGTYEGAPYPYDNTTGLVPVRIGNPDYSWEVSKKMDVALELGLFKDQLFISTGYYRNRTSKQLVGYPLPPSVGSPTGDVQANSPALVQNTGIEIDINSKNITTKNLTWTSSFNFTVPRNKLIEYPGLEGSAYANRLVVGEPLSIFKGYEYTGVDPLTGLHTVKDQNNDGVFNTKDYVPVFQGQNFFGGLLNSLTWKHIQLDVHFQFVKQTGNNVYKFLPAAGTTGKNYPAAVINRWQKTGDLTTFQRLGTTGAASTGRSRFANSSAVISDASFIRLKNLSVSYTLPTSLLKMLHAKQLRLYVQGQNLLTFTKYEGFDPEIADSRAVSTLRMITFGIQCVF